DIPPLDKIKGLHFLRHSVLQNFKIFNAEIGDEVISAEYADRDLDIPVSHIERRADSPIMVTTSPASGGVFIVADRACG
ncbi:MAG: hypothetical protein L6425_08250, partial [Candidatus Aminicenantes bacterium]|nr:hypothetical protein [Candidatus Aminicenantes bacterium]